MNKDKVNELQLLGTIKNADESGIIVYASQVFDSTAGKSVEDRISDVASTVSTNASNAATKAELNAETSNRVAADVNSAVIESGVLKLKNNAGKELAKVDLSSFQVSDQFVDSVTLVTLANKDTADAGFTPTETIPLPYILITFKINSGDDSKKKSPIRLPIANIWEVTNAGDLTLGKYSKGTDSSAVAGKDSVSTAIGKLENQIDGKAAKSHTHKVKINGTEKEITSDGKAVDLGTYLTAHQDISGKQNKLKTYTEDTSTTSPTVKISNVTDNGNKMGLAKVSIEANANGGTVVLSAGDSQSANVLTLHGNTAENILTLGDKTVATTDQIPTDNKSLANGAGYQTAAQVKATKVNNAVAADSATTAGSATKATQDGNGKVIADTYLTATAVGTKTYDVATIDAIFGN